MAESHELGKTGENTAVEHLRQAGYRILKRNWKCGRTEIDIIAENGEFIVFAEVKTRSEDYKEDPKRAISREKQRSIIFAADNYIKWNCIDKESRFDVITIVVKEKVPQIEHIEGAFYPTLR